MSGSTDLLLTASSSSSTRENLGSIPCNICRRQFSRYTCPRCNIPYCSLTCFRSESHAGCSEVFYKTELESQIKSEPSKSMEERRRMMELLKRFEEESADDAAALEEDDEDDFANRFNELDLNQASYDDIWSALTPAERDKFMKVIGDPSGDLAQQLLASEELEKQTIEPWWERPVDSDAEGASDGDTERVIARSPKSFGKRPSPMQVPSSMINASAASSGSGPSLLYNICAVLIAYAYSTRSFSTSPLSNLQNPDRQEARQLISRLVPFLSDKKSNVVLPTLSGLITDVWSRFPSGSMGANIFAVLLRDASKLLRPSLVTPLQNKDHSTATPTESDDHSPQPHSNANALCALSDISILFQPQPSDTSHTHATTRTSNGNHASHKLTFYAARILSIPTPILHVLAEEIAARAELIEREGLDGTAMQYPQSGSQLILEDAKPLLRLGPESHSLVEELA